MTKELPLIDIGAFMGETIEIDGTDVVTGKTVDGEAVVDKITGSVTDDICGFCGEGTVNFALFIDEPLVE